MDRKSIQFAIRKATIDDTEQTVKLSNAVWRSAYVNIMPQEIFDFNDTNINAIIEKGKGREFNKNGNINLVAIVDDNIVAYANAVSLSRYEHYRELNYADLWAIYIDPKYQHLGLGREIFDSVTNELKKQGCTKMVIGVLKENLQARRAYEKWGGKLDIYESVYEKMGCKFPEVFYLFNL